MLHTGPRRLPLVGRALLPGFAIALLAALAVWGAAGPPPQVAVTTRASTGPAGLQANGESRGPSLSADGRYLAFVSWASNLVPADTNDRADIFVKDLASGAVQIASISAAGAQADADSCAPSISGDGMFVAFTSDASNLVPGDTNSATDVFVRSLATGTRSG